MTDKKLGFFGIENHKFNFSQKVCWFHPAMFCLITSSKLSRQWFEFSLKVKVMRLNPGYLFKPFLLSADCWSGIKIEASRGRYLSPGTFVPPPHPQLTKIPHRLGLMRTTKNLQYKKLPACQNLPTEVTYVGIWWIIRCCQSDKTGPWTPVHIFRWKNSNGHIDYLGAVHKLCRLKGGGDKVIYADFEKT